MITIKEFMEVIDYRVTEGNDYCWSCFGKDAEPYNLSSWNQEHDGWSFNIVFDLRDQEVYMVEACDYKRNRAYRLINPDWQKDYKDYAKIHNEGYEDQAWDDVNYVDLESDDDWIQKASAIKVGEDYDTRVSIPLDLPEDEVFALMKAAHERDITFNQLVEEALKAVITEAERDPVGFKQRAEKWKDSQLNN